MVGVTFTIMPRIDKQSVQKRNRVATEILYEKSEEVERQAER